MHNESPWLSLSKGGERRGGRGERRGGEGGRGREGGRDTKGRLYEESDEVGGDGSKDRLPHKGASELNQISTASKTNREGGGGGGGGG